ncbi:MAG: DNA alkylation repair protein [Oscillospiraceae bacterium]|nr:DNA alkylation repair protein [Oscillospiraceae bacterium]
MSIQTDLLALAEPELQQFTAKLVPTVPPERILGIRTPKLRAYARSLAGTPAAEAFLQELPHTYLEENGLHAFLIESGKDYGRIMAQIETFLPYIDNWATCDGLSPKILKAHRPELLEKIRLWLTSDREYTVRFALKMLMDHFLDGDFSPEYLALAAAAEGRTYYIRMMQAWYFATALAKQYDSALPYLEQGRLDKWVHNKTITKARESFRITPEQKAYLKTLKIK